MLIVGSAVEHLVVHLHDAPQQLGVLKALAVDDVRLAHHAQVFDGQQAKLFLALFVQTGAPRQDRDAEAAPHQILDRRDRVDLQRNVEILDRQILAFQRRLKELAGVGVRQAEKELLLFELVDGDHALLCQRVIRRDRKHQTVRVQHEIAEVWVGASPLDEGEVKLVVLQHMVET